MARNPFSYGSPVGGPYFAGRVAEIDALVSRMENGVNVVVTAPRRYGKTSLLERGADRVVSAGGSIVRANLLRTPSLDALASRLATDAYALTGGPWLRAVQAVPEFLKRLRLNPSVTFDDKGKPVFTFTGVIGARDAEQLIDDVYRILAELAEERPAVLMLDEFQAFADLGPRLPGLLKALADEHPKVSLVMAGSRKHLMESLVLSSGAPLYNMAERIALGPIEEAVMRKFLRSRTKAGGKSMVPEVAERICDLAGPIPHDIQRLAYEVFDEATEEIDLGAVDAGMRRVVEHEAEGYAERFSKLAVGQRRVLFVLADTWVDQPQSSGFARATGYANPAGARKALIALEENETILNRGGAFQVADPFFREWLRRGT